jgi:EmrB/QacA subfamily drug resistance transporter
VESRERAALFVIVLGTLMVAVDTTIVLLALPVMSVELRAGLNVIIWTLLIYLLFTSVLTVNLGRLGDVYGRGRMYNAGFAIFTAGSFLCALAPDAYSLIGFRSLQAVGGSLMVANSGAIVADIFPARTRGAAFGYTTFGWSVGATLGIVLGGILTTLLGWRYIFLINVPIGLIAIPLGLRTLEDPVRRESHLDLSGMLLLGVGLSLVTYGATEAVALPNPAMDGIFVAGGLGVLALYLWRESWIPHPTLDLKQFRDRVLSYSLLATFLQSLGYLSVSFLVIMYLQGERGLSPLEASLLLVPGYVLASLLAPLAGRVSDRSGPRLPATLGIVGMLLAVVLYATLVFTPASPLLAVAGITIVAGLGTSLFYPANNSSIMGRARAENYGAVSGLARALGNLGTLGSFVLTVSVATLSVPRYVAFQAFLGTGTALDLSPSFLTGLRTALDVAAGVLVLAACFSFLRGTPPPRRPRRGPTPGLSDPSGSLVPRDPPSP